MSSNPVGPATHGASGTTPSAHLNRITKEHHVSLFASIPLIQVNQTKVTGAPQTAVTFDSLGTSVPAGTKHIVIEVSGAQTFTERRFCEVEVNGDTGDNYAHRQFDAAGSTISTRNNTSTGIGQGVDIPSESGPGYGGGYIFFPYAFRTDNLKTWQAMGSSLEARLHRHICCRKSTQAINSVTLRPWQKVPTTNQWAVGTIVTLFVVDEDRLLEEKALAAADTFTFDDLPTDTRHLGFVMHLRSSQQDYHQGDRVYQRINGDTTTSNYTTQRLGGEDVILNRIIDERFSEERIAWSAATTAPTSSYGSVVALYPEHQSTGFFQGWLSQHGTFENRWFPVSQEAGRWQNSAAMTSLNLRLQGGVTGNANYLPGSRVAMYGPAEPAARHVVPTDSEAAVTLAVPPGVANLHAIVVARSNASSDGDGLLVEINGDSICANYSRRRASAENSTHQTSATFDNEFGLLPASTAPPNTFGTCVLAFPQHDKNDRHQHILSCASMSGGRIALYAGRWRNTASVASITFRPGKGSEFVAGSVFELH